MTQEPGWDRIAVKKWSKGCNYSGNVKLERSVEVGI